MTSSAQRAVAIVGVGAIFPDAPDAGAFWANVRDGHYSISDVDPARWDPALYYDADPKAPDMTYSTIGGWVREWDWNPLAWKLPIPPRVGDGDGRRPEVGGRLHAHGADGLRLARPAAGPRAHRGRARQRDGRREALPDVVCASRSPSSHATSTALPASPRCAPDVRAAIASELHARMEADLPPTNEDTMPGELGNCLAGRVANLFNLRGPNFVVDAACASAMAAMDASIQGLLDHQFDTVVTGGVDRNMGVNSFIKFCAIGALSSTGTRPYSDGADGFVMGEGAGLFLLKRLADAERDGDRIYAVVRGMAGSSDGKGKGLTAPNPIGQKLAIERAWRNSGLSPAACSLMEGHGTSTAVGDYRRAVQPGRGLRRRRPGARLDRARLREVEHRPPQVRGRGGRDAQGDARDPPQGAAAEPRLRRPRTRTPTGRRRRSRSTPSCATGRCRTAPRASPASVRSASAARTTTP